jgi:hypothetical protein
MMTSEFPESGTFVELTAAAEPVGGVRVVRAEGAVITLSLPLAAVPDEGAAVTLRWPAEQHRNYVRGGGGEPVLLRRAGQEDAYGFIRDIGEQGVRAHFAGLDVQDGEELKLLVELGNDIVELKAVAVKVATLRQQVPPGPTSVELVAVFLPDETQARVIRRYVMHQQLLSRSRA